MDNRVFEMIADVNPASRGCYCPKVAQALAAHSVLPTGPDFVVPSKEFRVLLLRRLRRALPLAPKRCHPAGPPVRLCPSRSPGTQSRAAGARGGAHREPRGRGRPRAHAALDRSRGTCRVASARPRSLLELPVPPCDASDGAELPLGELLAAPL